MSRSASPTPSAAVRNGKEGAAAPLLQLRGEVRGALQAPEAIRVLSFDLDDTLWDNAPVMANAYAAERRYLEHHHPSIPASELDGLQELFARVRREHPEIRANMTEARKQTYRQLGRGLGMDQALAARMAEGAFTAFITARNEVTAYLFPGVLSMLRRVREQGYTLVALSNGNSDPKTMDNELRDMFALHITQTSANACKSTGIPFQRLLQALPEVAPAQIVHVGDSLPTDILPARALGLQTVLVGRQGQPVELDHAADLWALLEGSP